MLRCVRSTNNEPRVESSAADKLEPVIGRNYALIVKFRERIAKGS
jgi:hypothetical protein